MVDTAACGNEAQVGEGIRRSTIDRADIFVIAKLWLTAYGYDSALALLTTASPVISPRDVNGLTSSIRRDFLWLPGRA